MSFTSGALSVRRFRVLDPVPPTLPQTASLAVRRYTFRPINPERGERHAFGWCNPRDPIAETFDYDDLVDGPFLLLGARQDRKHFNPILFKARLTKRIRAVCAERKIARLTRQQRLVVEEELAVEVNRETSPVSAFCQVLWDLSTNMLYMAATSNAACESVQELFSATFDLRIRHESPAIIHGRHDPEELSPLQAQQRYPESGRNFVTDLLQDLIESGNSQVELHGPLVFQDGEGKLTIQGEDAPHVPEVNTALHSGRKLTRATLVIQEREDKWRATLDADTFDLKGVLLPIPTLPNAEEYLSLRIQSLLRLFDLIDQLYANSIESIPSIPSIPSIA
ncbi:hypothetical protein GC173_11540 [bacterium]|nr:hypothetical protein [bacterium]